MKWIIGKYFALTNWWHDMLRARYERKQIKQLLEILLAEDPDGCDICDGNPKECICGELDCGPDCD